MEILLQKGLEGQEVMSTLWLEGEKEGKSKRKTTEKVACVQTIPNEKGIVCATLLSLAYSMHQHSISIAV